MTPQGELKRPREQKVLTAQTDGSRLIEEVLMIEKSAYTKAIFALKSLRNELPKNEFVQFVTEETLKELQEI